MMEKILKIWTPARNYIKLQLKKKKKKKKKKKHMINI